MSRGRFGFGSCPRTRRGRAAYTRRGARLPKRAESTTIPVPSAWLPCTVLLATRVIIVTNTYRVIEVEDGKDVARVGLAPREASAEVA